MAPSQINLLADQVFADSPASHEATRYSESTKSHPYLNSSTYSLVRMGLPQGASRAPRYCEYDLSPWVRNQAALGPYERQLLGDIFMSPHELVLISGSAGSGKSSAVEAVLGFHEKNYAMHGAEFTAAPAPRHCRINCNKRASEFRNIASKKGENAALDWLWERVTLRLPKAILTSLEPRARAGNLTREQCAVQLAEQAYRWSIGSVDVPSGIGEFDWGVIAQLGEPEQTGKSEDFSKLLSRVNRMDSGKRLEYWLGMYDALAITMGASRRKLVLLLDNIDPFPQFAQEAVRDRLIGLVSGARFKLVVPVRYSSFRVISDTLQYNWYAHSGPYPLDVICQRLWSFVLEPEQYPAYCQMRDKEWRAKSVLRALDILLKLTRGTEDYRALGSMLVAGAGDSVRRALRAAEALFTSDFLSFKYDPGAIAHIQRIRANVDAVIAVGKMGHSVREEILSCLADADLSFGSSEWVDAAGIRCADVAIDALSSQNGGIRWAGSANHAWEQPELFRYCEEDIGDAYFAIESAAQEVGVEHSGVCGALAGRFNDRCVESLSSGGGRQNTPARVLSSAKAILAGGPTPECVEGEVELSLDWDHGHCVRSVSRVNAAYVAMRELIRNKHLHNLLDFPGQDGILPLTLLYKIALSYPASISLREIDAGLEAGGVPPKDRTELFNSLARTDGRVIWVDSRFESRTWDNWMELADQPVTLLHSAWLYLGTVLDEIDYLLNALAADAARELFSERLSSALTSIQGMRRSGFEWRSFPGVARGIPLDLLIRATASMVSVAGRHFARLEAPSQKMDERTRLAEQVATRNVVIEWRNELERAAREEEEIHFQGLNRAEWLSVLGRAGRIRGDGPASGRRGRGKKALARIDKALRSERLWRPGILDQFHS